MSKSKSKFPDFKEISSMAGKLFGDLRKSIGEIYEDYKKKHGEEPVREKPKASSAKPKAEESKTEKPVRAAQPKKPKEESKGDSSKN